MHGGWSDHHRGWASYREPYPASSRVPLGSQLCRAIRWVIDPSVAAFQGASASRRFKLFTSHLIISAAWSAPCLCWCYPDPLFALQDAAAILLIVAFVDVIGPLLTSDRQFSQQNAPRAHARLAVTGAVQFAARGTRPTHCTASIRCF